MRRHTVRAIATLAAATALASAGAQQPQSGARHERPVYPAGAGANRLALDAALLAGAQPFRVEQVNASEGRVAVARGGASDLRLYDTAGNEVPYLLVTPEVEARWRGGRLLRVASTKDASGFELDLEALLPVDRVRLDGLPVPFLKRVRLEGSGDRTRWTVLAADATLFDLPDEGLEHTSLDFTAGSYRFLRITWDDRSSARMPLPRRVEARVASAVQGPAPLRAAVTIERRASEPGKSRFRIRLPGGHLPIVALELDVSAERVMRTARVSEGRLDGGQVVPTELGSATLRRAVRAGVSASALRIPLASPTEAQLELVVDDGNNRPLDVTGATAVFATLPFVYFESAGGDSLVARYGDRRLPAPHYDLEAMRDRVPALSLAEARWGAPREAPGVGPVAGDGALPMAGGAIDVKSFRFARPIPSGGPGLATLQLDAAVLAHSTLSDLRIGTSDGHQVPFLVERLDEPLALALPPIESVKSARDGTARSRYRIRLPYAGLPGSRLVLRTDARVFDRHVTVEVEPSPSPADARPRGVGRDGQRIVANATWVNTEPDTPAAALTLERPPLASTELTLLIDEGDNAPLPLRDVSLLLPGYRLRFFRDGSTALTLLYGRPDLPAPRYDLALVAPRLLGAAAEDVVPGPESGVSNVTGITPTVVFWCALAVAIAVLLVLIVRLLRPSDARGAPPAPPSTPPSPAASGE